MEHKANIEGGGLQNRVWRVRRKILSLAIVLSLCWIKPTVAQECFSETFKFNEQSVTNDPISATMVNVPIAVHEISGVQRVVVSANGGFTLFIGAAVNETHLVISTTQAFEDFLKTETIAFTFATLAFTCNSGSTKTIRLQVPIMDENLYAPAFSLPEYTITLPLPLSKGFDLTQYIDEGRGIVAVDYDLSGNQITFTLEDNPYFLVESETGATVKQSVARLKTANMVMHIDGELSLTITGTDAGQPESRSGTAVLKISGDPLIPYIQPPQFQQVLYKHTYKRTETFPTIEANLQTNTFDSGTNFELSGDDKALLAITQKTDRSGAVVTLQPGTSIPESKTFMSAIVTATRPGAEMDGRTAIVVEVEPEVKLLPAFEQPIYAGSVSSAKVVTLNTGMSLVATTTTEGVTIGLAGEDSQYFSYVYSDNSITLRALDTLTDEVLKQRYYFHFTVEATKANVGKGVAFVVLDVLKPNVIVPKFEQLYYEGTVTEAGVADVPEIQIIEATYVTGLTFAYAGDNSLFTITNNRNKFTLTPNGITEEKLNGKSYLLVRIRASLDQAVVAETIVIIKVVRPVVITPKFENSFIQGQLTAATNVLTPIKAVVDPITFSTDTTIRLQDSTLFEPKATTVVNEFTISLRSGVQIPNESHLTLILEATNPKSPTVSCLILIEVIRNAPVAPEFEQLLYQGQINSANELEELKVKLKPGTYDDTILFSLSDHDAILFNYTQLDSDELLITFNDTITEDDFINRSSLRFDVHAVGQNNLEAIVPVLIQINKALVKVPKFEKELYKSSIGTDLRLVAFETIQLVEDTSAEGLLVEIRLNNSDLFVASLANQRTVTISLKEDLTPEDVMGFKAFEFVVEVSNPDVGAGFATILIDIVRVAPEFTAVSYTGTVAETAKEINFPGKIELKSETIAGTVSYALLGEHSALVTYTINTDLSLKFSLKNEVTVDQLKDLAQINFVVQASKPDSSPASASITARIIRPVQAVFVKSSFTGTLTESQTIVNFGTDKIELLAGTLQEDTSFTPTDGDSGLFEASLQPEGVIQLNLKSTVNWNQIRYRPYLSFTLQATNPGAAASSTAINVNIENLPVPTPVFTKTFYRGTLQKGIREIAFSAPEVITLEAATITATLTYRVVENDYDLFEVTREENKFKVSLNDSVTEQDYDGRDLLSFQIEASNAYGAMDTTIVLISIQVDDIIPPVLTETIYKGSIRERTTEVAIPTEITFRQGTSSALTEIGLTDGDSDWFTYIYSESKVSIAVKSDDSIKWDQIVDRNYLSFLLQATNPGSSAASAFVQLDIQRTPIKAPIFKSSTFQGFLEEGSREVKFPQDGSIELEESSLLQGFSSVLVDNDYLLFDHVMVRNQVLVTLKTTVSEQDLENKLYLRFNVAVSNPGSNSVTAAVVVDLKRETTPINTPLFEHSVYQGTIKDDFTLSLETPILITEGTYSADVVLRIIDSNSDLLRVVQDDREAVVHLSKTISAEDLKDLDNLHATIQAVNEQAAVSTCFLIVTLPKEVVEPCTETPPVIDCTDCYNCSTGEPLNDVPFFPYGNYRFNLKTDSTGVIGTVRASVKDPSFNLVHTADISDAYLKPKVTLTSDGILRILEPLLPSKHTFHVIALNPNSAKQTSVSVTLDVTEVAECPTDPGAPVATTVEKLLIIESLAEESTHSNIFPSQLAECEYELIDEKPFLGYNYFSIDTTRHWLSSERFDRENASLFEGMIIPQFQLRLRLICPDQQQSSRMAKRSLVETSDINFARDVTMINVIVTDVNDNDPRFVSPTSGQNFLLGFPASSIASNLLLPHLIVVLAEDLDEGLNAKIRYSLNSNDDFEIDPEQGVIYPTKNAMKSSASVSLVVTATDQDGAASGRSSQLTLNVHRLEEDNLVMMTTVGIIDGASVIDRINRNTNGITLKALMEARVPSNEQANDSRSSSQRNDENTVLRMIVYAFNGANVLQDSDTIKRIIQSSELSESISSEAYKNLICYDSEAECNARLDSDPTRIGLIAATSVLGALFLISAGLAVFLYLTFVRPLRKAAADPSDIVQLENDFDISPPPSPPMLGAKKASESESLGSDNERKISIQITGITDQESEDSRIPMERLARSLDGRLEKVDEYGSVSSRATLEDTSLQEPKNVKFNELVERIEVVEHHPERGDGDDDSIYNERL
ncbi:uncharacterized protein LOC131690052 [Topomyia yanbarensis]|uniref:uncharacterized protein LOC131690052 n=1 Tax=Topomyia yanbarensis TaxID=2498891 RepID=UPI00273B80FB|nr:uncharacterized protein LOC131690052 [Topomyia yanbarensis]